MSPSPPSGRFVDPNERLLASTIPPPPPSRRARIGQLIAQLRWRDVRLVGAWFHSREARSCLLAALGGAALMFGFYRSEAASAASTALAALQRTEAPSTARVERASIRPEPRALGSARQAATPPPPPLAEASDVEQTVTSSDVDRVDPGPPATVERRPARAAARRAATLKKSAGKKVSKKKLVKKKRKAKQAVARAPTRAGRRSRAERATRSGAAAWLTDEVRGKGAIASQH